MKNRKIKVLFAIDRMNIGGAPAVVFEQSRQLPSEEFDVYLLTLYPSKADNYLSSIGHINKSKQQHFILKRRSIFDIPTWVSIYKYFKKNNFDIVYTHLFLTNLIVRICAWLAGVKVIISTEHSIYKNKKLWQKLVDKILSFITFRIVVATQEIADFTAKQEHIPARKFVVVPHIISIPDVSNDRVAELKERSNFIQDNFVFLTIARFQEEKELPSAITAFSRIIKKFPNARYILVGHGPLKQELHGLIIELGIEDRCFIIDDAISARDYYALADAFILPSNREGQSLVTYEAMLSKTVVLASRLPTIEGIINDRENGFLFEPKNIEDIEAAMEYVLNNQDSLEIIKDNAYSSVQSYVEKHTISSLVDILKKSLV